MSSLWTPDGERPVQREPAAPRQRTDDGDAGASGSASAHDGGDDALRAAVAALGIDLDSLTEEEKDQVRAELSEMMAVRRQVAETPAAEMLANHLMRFFDLVTIYLDADPPAFNDAATVIEAIRGVVEVIGPRLGEQERTVREMLSQAQMLFVQVKDAAAASD